MKVFSITALLLALAGAMLMPVRSGHAAGAVEMQVERIVNNAIDEYNQAMEEGDPEAWLKYFTDNVDRRSPLSAQSGRTQFTEYYRGEFDSFKARWSTKKLLVTGRSAAVLFDWEAVDRKSGAPLKVEMAAFFELASSGRFDKVAFVFDPARLAQSGAAQR